MYKILIVDDEIKILKATQGFLKSNGFDVVTTSSASHAVEIVRDQEIALVLLDYKMPEMMGDLVAGAILKVNPKQQIAMYSCDLTREAIKDSMKAGAVDFIEKTLPPDELLAQVVSYCNRFEQVLRTIRPTKNKSENRSVLELVGMIGQSEMLAETARTILKVAAVSDTSVLIRGESGTGKELVARAIHKQSTRRDGPFIAINCGAIPKDLLESELFGHVKGAFSGAVADKAGKFALANHGTLFLDEIGDMPMDLQVKLLRVLQEREITPVGGRYAQKINVRIVSATHRKIEDMIASGSFREDLMYRIRVIEVDVPPLRSRTDDIEPLVAHFTERYNKKNGAKKFFQRRTLEILKRYSWPGNVRELEALVEKQMVISDENMIRPDDLDHRLFSSAPDSALEITIEQFRSLKRDEERKFVEETVLQVGGNKAAAARRLQVTPNHLQFLLKG